MNDTTERVARLQEASKRFTEQMTKLIYKSGELGERFSHMVGFASDLISAAEPPDQDAADLPDNANEMLDHNSQQVSHCTQEHKALRLKTFDELDTVIYGFEHYREYFTAGSLEDVETLLVNYHRTLLALLDKCSDIGNKLPGMRSSPVFSYLTVSHHITEDEIRKTTNSANQAMYTISAIR